MNLRILALLLGLAALAACGDGSDMRSETMGSAPRRTAGATATGMAMMDTTPGMAR